MITLRQREELADEFRMIANEIQTARSLDDLTNSSCWASSTLARLDDLIAREMFVDARPEDLHA